jgi:hypothetical protein
MTVTESKGLKKGSRVYWRGDPTDSGKVTGTSWDAVTIAWDNGQVAIVHTGTCAKLSDRRQGRPRCKGSEPTPRKQPMPEQVYVKPGEEWLAVTCHNHSCGRRILLDPVGPEMRDDEGALIFPADTVLVICPHCELESLYLSDEIRCELGQRRH